MQYRLLQYASIPPIWWGKPLLALSRARIENGIGYCRVISDHVTRSRGAKWFCVLSSRIARPPYNATHWAVAMATTAAAPASRAIMTHLAFDHTTDRPTVNRQFDQKTEKRTGRFAEMCRWKFGANNRSKWIF